MKTIWKFPLNTTDTQSLLVPKGASALCVQIQNEQPCLWMLVNTSEVNELRVIRTIGTGHPIEDGNISAYSYVGTYQLSNGLVFHVFEEN